MTLIARLSAATLVAALAPTVGAAPAFASSQESKVESTTRPGPATSARAAVVADTTPAGLEVLGHAHYRWRLAALDRTPLSLVDHRGEVLVINVWATWCVPCVAELASFERLRDTLGDEVRDDIRFLFVSPEDPGHVRDFVRQRGWELPFAVEAEPMPDAFGLEAVPTTWIIDTAGRIVLKHRGAAEWDTPEMVAFLEYLAE